jgi:hypothetical protein
MNGDSDTLDYVLPLLRHCGVRGRRRKISNQAVESVCRQARRHSFCNGSVLLRKNRIPVRRYTKAEFTDSAITTQVRRPYINTVA